MGHYELAAGDVVGKGDSAAETPAVFAALRAAERTARAALIAGCEDDIATIGRFFERPLSDARRDAHDALALNLGRDTFERIGAACADKVRANVGLRARARFRMYTTQLARAEVQISQAIAARSLVAAKRPLPRMFTVGRIEIEWLRSPDPPERFTDVDGWVEELYACLRDEVGASVRAALDRVLSRGFQRLAIIKARLDLAR